MKKTTKPKSSSLPTVVIGSDHAGYDAKQAVVKHLAKLGYVVVDIGGFDREAHDDYPDYAAEVAKAVVSDRPGATMGVLICGSGTGMAIAANKITGVRASVLYDKYSAEMARHDNDANIACLRGRGFSPAKDAKLVETFLATPFSGMPRHKRRIKKVAQLERAS